MRKFIILLVFVIPDFGHCTQNTAIDQLIVDLQNITCVYTYIFNLRFYIFLVISQILIQFSVSADISFIFQPIQCFFNFFVVFPEVDIYFVNHQYCNILCCSLEIGVVFYHKQGFKNFQCKFIKQVVFSKSDGINDFSFDNRLHSFKHFIETNQYFFLFVCQ